MTITTDTPAPPAGRKDWQDARHAPDHGKSAAAAVGFQLSARHIQACAAEDMRILGLTELPEPRPYMVPVTRGTDAERKARIDTWAARHGTTAHHDPASGTYRATVRFGPVELTVYMLAEQDMAERLAAIYGDLAAHRAEVDAMPLEAQS